MRTALATLPLVLALTLAACLAACKDDGGAKTYDEVPEAEAPATYAGELCRLIMDTCDCGDLPFSSLEECTDQVSQEIDADLAAAQADGLTYYPECMADYLNFLTHDIQCKTIGDLTSDPELLAGFSQLPCKVVAGDGVEGDACTQYSSVFGDSCAQGLQCYDTCTLTPTYETKQLGEVCNVNTDLCESGSACFIDPMAPMDPATCRPLPGEGESCMSTFQCDVGLSCDSTDYLCKGPVGLGEACDGFSVMCASGLFCDQVALTCAETLAPGVACVDDEQCGVGYVCREEVDGAGDVCRVEGPLLCGG